MEPDRIRTWLDDNPQVFERFEREALRAISRGFKHYSARTIMEVLRHESNLKADPDFQRKINNDIIPTVARDFMDAHPEAPEKFFELRNASAVKRAHPAHESGGAS